MPGRRESFVTFSVYSEFGRLDAIAPRTYPTVFPRITDTPPGCAQEFRTFDNLGGIHPKTARLA
jgi:hypothetical protein